MPVKLCEFKEDGFKFAKENITSFINDETYYYYTSSLNKVEEIVTDNNNYRLIYKLVNFLELRWYVCLNNGNLYKIENERGSCGNYNLYKYDNPMSYFYYYGNCRDKFV